MKTVNVYQVDSFANAIFGGNPAGVVPNADVLTDDEMQKIAREMNLSETAFVFRPTTDKADVRLRFFTPSGAEIAFCGHATVAALFQLAKLDLFGLGSRSTNKVRVETKAGILPMSVSNDGVAPKLTFVAPPVEMQVYRLQSAAFANAFGIPETLIKNEGTILLDTKLNYVYIPVASLKALGEQAFDYARIRKAFGDEGVVVFCLYTHQAKDKRADLHARGLAPNVGVDEDPFTGSMQAGLVFAAKQNGYLDASKQTIVTEQGHFVGRPGQAMVRHNTATNEITVTASAAPVFSARMEF